jgi:transcriptional regulator with XRE-family HTH domain
MAETLGDRIRIARARLRLSQAALARRIGISSTAMNAIESGGADPRASRITALAKALQVRPDYLLGYQEEVQEGESMSAETALV